MKKLFHFLGGFALVALSGCAMHLFNIGGGDITEDSVHVKIKLFKILTDEQVVDATEVCGGWPTYVDHIAFSLSPYDDRLTNVVPPEEDVSADRINDAMETEGTFGIARSVIVYCFR